MNPRVILITGLLAFNGLLLVMGARAFARWVKIHYPRQASAILGGLWIGGIAIGWLLVRELRTEPVYQANDLLTLQEPVVARTISAEREVRSYACVVDVHEHLGVLEVESESGTLKARVESNNTSAPIYCPIGAAIRIEMAWLHGPSVTRRAVNPSPASEGILFQPGKGTVFYGGKFRAAAACCTDRQRQPPRP